MTRVVLTAAWRLTADVIYRSSGVVVAKTLGAVAAVALWLMYVGHRISTRSTRKA